jgi:hypothetical protein
MIAALILVLSSPVAAQIRIGIVINAGGEQLSDSTGGIVFTVASPGAKRDQDAFDWATMGVPATHGAFTMGSPYGTLWYRLTDANDCVDGTIDPDLEGTVDDCVRQAWYSNKAQFFSRGRQQDADPGTPVCAVIVLAYSGAFKVCVDFSQQPAVRTKTRLFGTGDRLAGVNSRTDNWMVSPTEADILYITVDSEIRRCNAATANLPLDSTDAGDCELLLDIQNSTFRDLVATNCGVTAASIANANVWSFYIANNGYTASAGKIVATFYVLDPDDGFICNAFIDDWSTANTTTYFGMGGGDSGITPDGRFGTWINQAVECESHPTNPGAHGADMYVRDFTLDTTTIWCDQDGAPGHLSPVWQGYVAEDNHSSLGQDLRHNQFLSMPAMGTAPPSVYHNVEFGSNSFVQPTMLTAQDTAVLPFNQQIACTLTTSPAPDNDWTIERELVCGFWGAAQWLVVGPSMTDFDAAGKGGDETAPYYGAPKPPMSSDGRWLLVMTNGGTDRMDAYFVRIPRANIPAASAPVPFLDRTFGAAKR